VSTFAILHPSGLLGKELRETIGARHPEWSDLRLLSTREDEIGTLTEVGGAAALVGGYEPGSLEGVSVAFFCGAMAASRPLLAELPAETTAIVLSLDAAVEDGEPVVVGVNSAAMQGRRVLLSPHPAVVMLAHLLHPLQNLAPEEVVATLVQPASVRDDAGLEELFEQTRQIVSMTRRTPTPVFGAQLAFNLLPASLPAAPVAGLLHSVLGGASVALQILQGSVFHSLSASLYVRFAGQPAVQAVRKALAAHPYLEPADKPRHLGPIDAAASEKVLFGALRKDDAAGGFWLWAVMDNLTRGGALSAIEIAEAVM
jgi:aspartate-semialdehyde dehydrogenase